MTQIDDEREKRLREATRRFQRVALELHSESDRGCAVLLLCLLEDALKEMIVGFLVDGGADRTNSLAPPGRLKVAIDNAVLLGLLSERQARTFQSLVKVRNKFAHGVMEGLTFDSPEIASAVKSIAPAVQLPDAQDRELRSETIRKQFLTHASIVWIVMALRSAFTTRLQPAEDPDSSKIARDIYQAQFKQT